MKKIMAILIVFFIVGAVAMNAAQNNFNKNNNDMKMVSDQNNQLSAVGSGDKPSISSPEDFSRPIDQERRKNNEWKGWPEDFMGNIDAALNGDGPFKGKAYFFKGDQYFRYDWYKDKVEVGYPQEIKDNWPGFPRNFFRNIDAAVSGAGRHNGKAYFFKGSEYLQYDWQRDQVDRGYPRSIGSDWRGLPMTFTRDLDAVLPGVGEFRNKVYFFKGNQFVRYDWDREQCDPGFPKNINDYIRDLPRGFASRIDAAVMGDGPFAGKIYFFKNDRYVRIDINMLTVDRGFPLPIGNGYDNDYNRGGNRNDDDDRRWDNGRNDDNRKWHGNKKNEDDKDRWSDPGETGNRDDDYYNTSRIEEYPVPGKAYFFRGDLYIRYDMMRDKMDPGYPRKTKQSFTGWPSRFLETVDAALVGEGQYKGKIYFFSADEYIRYDIAQKRVANGFPKRISGNWGGMPYDFAQGIDAAVSGQGPLKGKAFFFKGDRYIRYDWATDRIDPGYPKGISGRWPGMPYAFTTGIDAAINGTGASQGKVYFFKGDQYIRYDWAKDKTDPGYPKPVKGNWYGIPGQFNEGWEDGFCIVD